MFEPIVVPHKAGEYNFYLIGKDGQILIHNCLAIDAPSTIKLDEALANNHEIILHNLSLEVIK